MTLFNPIQTTNSIPFGGNVASGSNSSSRGFGIQSAALLALSQIGVSSSATTPAGSAGAASGTAAVGATSGGAASAQPASATVQSFLQSLYAALQVQAAASDMTQGGANASSTSAAVSAHGHHHGHGGAHVREEMANVAQQLSSSVATGSSSSSATTGTSPVASSTSGSVSALQQTFNSLVTSAGTSNSSQATLANFLRAFASDLSNKPAGSILSTSA